MDKGSCYNDLLMHALLPSRIIRERQGLDNRNRLGLGRFKIKGRVTRSPGVAKVRVSEMTDETEISAI